MKRRHLFELQDYGWFPGSWRDLITDLLSGAEAAFEIYAPVAQLLAPLVRPKDEFRIVDLCSGAGLPIVTVLGAMDGEAAGKVRITLSIPVQFPDLTSSG